MQKRADLAFSVVVLAIVSWLVWQATGWEPRARLFPLAAGVVALVAAAGQTIFAARQLRAAPPLATATLVDDDAADAPARSTAGAIVAQAIEGAFGPGSLASGEELIAPEIVRQRTTEMVVWVLGITAGVLVLGFELGATVMSLAFLRLTAHERWRTSICVALGTYLFFYVIFDRGLHIPFPAGLIADALGLQALDHYVSDPIASVFERIGAG